MGHIFFGGGKIGMRKPCNLPSGYTELVYIESSGTQYIDTGFMPKYNTRTILNVSDVTSVDRFMFGAKTSDSSTVANQYALLIYSSTVIRSDYFGTNASATIASLTERTTIDKNGATLSAWGAVIQNTEVSSGEVPYSLYLFSANIANTAQHFSSFRLYSCQIYDDDTLVRDFVPCINPDGEVGLYDLVNKQFYGNAGTGSFTGLSENLPSSYTELVYIESSGTQYIDTGLTSDAEDVTYEAEIMFTGTVTTRQLFGGNGGYYFGVTTSKVYEFSSTTNITYSSGTYDEITYEADATNGSARLTVNGITNTYTRTFSNESIYLFAIASSGEASCYCGCRVKSFLIYKKGSLVRDFVPCINPDGEVGLYDLANCQFYGNAGSDSFVGSEVA